MRKTLQDIEHNVSSVSHSHELNSKLQETSSLSQTHAQTDSAEDRRATLSLVVERSKGTIVGRRILREGTVRCIVGVIGAMRSFSSRTHIDLVVGVKVIEPAAHRAHVPTS